jgi:hypothetical protein
VTLPPEAWEADADARARGRVAMFNLGRPHGLDGWTMDLRQYEAVREVILRTLDALGGEALLKDLVAAGQAELGDTELFPKGRLTNYVRFTKVDLEARGEVERVPGSSPQRVRLASA